AAARDAWIYQNKRFKSLKVTPQYPHVQISSIRECCQECKPVKNGDTNGNGKEKCSCGDWCQDQKALHICTSVFGGSGWPKSKKENTMEKMWWNTPTEDLSVERSKSRRQATNSNKFSGNDNGKAPIPSQYPIVGPLCSDTKSKKRSVPILSKGKPPASHRWERADNMIHANPPSNNPPAIGSSRQIATLNEYDASSGKLFVDLRPENP
ncbi:hypothetical protein HID58_043927, partial [Brassica napus]